MKTIHLNRIAMILALVLAVSTLTIPALADRYATSGNGGETSIFFVESYGNAKVIFEQQVGLCYEWSYTHAIDGILGNEDEWGKYHIYVETPYGSTYIEDWDKTFNGGSYTLSLNGSGIYRIRMVPYTGQELTDSWTLDEFVGWTTYPSWWVSETRNCITKTSVSTSVYVQQVDQDTGAVLSNRSVTVSYGSNSVSAGSTPSGYRLVSSSSQSVYVDTNGRADKSTVTFYYKREAKAATLRVTCVDEYGYTIRSYEESISADRTVYPPSIDGYKTTSSGKKVSYNSSYGTCNPSGITFYYQKNDTPQITRPDPNPNPIPTSWDTKYKPGVSDKNPNGIDNLSRLTDGNSGTVFGYTLYNSDKKNGLPDFTANFNGSSVSGIKIRNGDGGDYYRYMRINTFYVKVYTNSGSYTESTMTVPDSPSSDYYSFSFRQRYSGVTRIEIYITDRHTGSGEDTNRVRIRDIAFY